MTLNASLCPFGQFFGLDGKPLEDGYVYIGVVGLDPIANPVPIFYDAALTIPAPNPMRTIAGYVSNAGAPTNVFTSNNYSIKVTDKNNVQIYYVADFLLTTNFSDLRTELASTSGASLVGSITTESGSIPFTLQTSSRLKLHAVAHFGVDPTGATNTTTALKAFYDACISSGKGGTIPAGSYKVTPGILKFYSGGVVDKFWPNIETAGNLATKFIVDTSTNIDLPILELTNVVTNGIQGSYTYTFWKGGSHGGFSIIDSSGQVAANRVGLQLTGTWYTKFGLITGTTLRSDLIRLPMNALAGNNPDPFSCAFLEFDGFSSTSAQGLVVNNLNGVGMDSWVVNSVSSTYDIGGVWFGVGQGCVIKQFSVSGSSGWAFDDGGQSGVNGANRLQILVAEFDNPQYGIRINKLADFEIEFIRFNHRYNFSPLNSSGKYWPLVCLDITGGSSPNVNRGTIGIFNRIESGSTLANLGKFLDCHSGSNISDLSIDVDYADNGGLGVTDSWITAGMNLSQASSIVKISRKSESLWDSMNKDLSCGIGGAAVTLIPNAGFGTPAAKIGFSVGQTIPSMSTQYTLATSTYTAKRAGLYSVFAAFQLTCAVGTRVRIAFVTTVAGTECASWDYQANASVQGYQNQGYVFLNAGDTVYVTADQNTATASIAATPQANSNECRFAVIPL
jgi:hypothetical protein